MFWHFKLSIICCILSQNLTENEAPWDELCDQLLHLKSTLCSLCLCLRSKSRKVFPASAKSSEHPKTTEGDYIIFKTYSNIVLHEIKSDIVITEILTSA